jgi:hypothetical protein
MVLTQFIMTEIQNRNPREHQHVDGRTSHELLQDISSLALYDIYSDPLMASDATINQGLQKNMPLSAPLRYCYVDRTTKLITLAQAMAAEKRRGGEVEKHQGGEVSIGDHTPPATIFLRNSNNSNQMNCNHLVAPAAMAATVSVASSMRKRVMKTTGDIFFQQR